MLEFKDGKIVSLHRSSTIPRWQAVCWEPPKGRGSVSASQFATSPGEPCAPPVEARKLASRMVSIGIAPISGRSAASNASSLGALGREQQYSIVGRDRLFRIGQRHEIEFGDLAVA